MYPWDRAAGLAEPRAEAIPAAAIRAVQVALDRRDNGGDVGAPAAR